MERRCAIALARVTAHQRAPRLLVERIKTEKLPATLDGLSERAIVFKRRHQTTDHLTRTLLEPLSVRLDPFVGAVRQQVALIQRRCLTERGQIAFMGSIRCLFERHHVDDRRRLFTPAERARFAGDERLELRPAFPQVMEFASEVCLRLDVGRLRPESPARALTRNRTAARVEHEKRDELLLTGARRTHDRATVNTNSEPAE